MPTLITCRSSSGLHKIPGHFSPKHIAKVTLANYGYSGVSHKTFFAFDHTVVIKTILNSTSVLSSTQEMYELRNQMERDSVYVPIAEICYLLLFHVHWIC
jgi:hypothetical protein